MVRGECGLGKTALLDWVSSRPATARCCVPPGSRRRWSWPSPGCISCSRPILSRLDNLPSPQRDALQMAFGFREGAAPDRFFIALAVLSLLADPAKRQPLICLIDDEQWLDRASAQALAFVRGAWVRSPWA